MFKPTGQWIMQKVYKMTFLENKSNSSPSALLLAIIYFRMAKADPFCIKNRRERKRKKRKAACQTELAQGFHTEANETVINLPA